MLLVELIAYSRESLVGLTRTLQRGTLFISHPNGRSSYQIIFLKGSSWATPGSLGGVRSGMEDHGDQDQSSTMPLFAQGNVSFTIRHLLFFCAIEGTPLPAL